MTARPRALLASFLSLAIVVLCPGPEAWAAIAKTARPAQTPSAPSAPALPASVVPAGRPMSPAAILEGSGSLAAGTAFGVGATHTVEKHQETNHVIAEAIQARRAAVAYGAASLEASEAAPEERKVIADLLMRLAASDRTADIEGLGVVSVRDAASSLKRVVLAEPGEGRNPRALRHESLEEFQVSHVGFGPGHDAPTIYLSREFARQAAPVALEAVLLNDLIELGARSMAKQAGLYWSEEMARKAMDAAAAQAMQLAPRVFHYTRAAVGGLAPDFERLGIVAEVHREYLSPDPAKQQVIFNRLAALRAKGFEPGELSPALLKLQEGLDNLVGPAGLRQGRGAAERELKELKKTSPDLYARLTKEPAVHSQVQGLAWRVHATLKDGRDISAMVRLIGDPRRLERVWSSWTQPDPTATIPVLDHVPNIRTNLAEALERVRAKEISEKILLEREITGLENLVAKHPLVADWREMKTQLMNQAQDLRQELRGLPPVRGKSPQATDLRERKNKSRENIRRIGEQVGILKEKVEFLQQRAKPLAQISIALREWFTDMKGLSVAGDYLWDKDGKNLDILMVVPGDASPKKLRPEVLRKVSGLNLSGQVDLMGYVVGEKWLRGAYFDVDRNALISRFSMLGLSLWGVNLAQFFHRLPERELWSASLDQLQQAQAALASSHWRGSQLRLRLALSLMTALALKLYGKGMAESLPNWMTLVEADMALGSDAARADLEAQAAALQAALQDLRETGRRREAERLLQRAFDKLYRQGEPGQVGGVLIGAASTSAEPLSRQPLYDLDEKQAREWVDHLAQSGQPVDNAAELLSGALERVKAKARYWEWLPETLALGAFASTGVTAFGRPVEVRVRVRELEDRPEFLGALVEAAPERESAGKDRYDIFINGAVFRMEPQAVEIVVGSLIRQLGLAMEGWPLSAARDRAMAELQESRVRDDKKDREVLGLAVADFEKGVRISFVEGGHQAQPMARKWTRRAHQAEALRLAQAVSDYLNAPQRRLGGKILLGYTTQAMMPLAQQMAEVFAGNGHEVAIAEGETLPASLHHAVREGAYRLGFLISKETVLPFGHFKGQIPEEELTEILATENVVKRIRRLRLEAARLQGLASDRSEVQTSYLSSLKGRFDIQRLAQSSTRLLIDTDQGEMGVLLKALGLQDGTVNLGENEQALRERMLAVPAGKKRLGVILGREDASIRILDVDGAPIRPSDLSLIFSWYLVRHRGHRGKIFRAFTQTRLLDRLAQIHGLQIEEVDPSVWGISEADSIVLSPWTPYNDLFSQALLAAEIVTKTGQSLGGLLQSIRRELGSPLDYQKAMVRVPAPYTDKIADRLSADDFKKFLARDLGIPENRLQARKSLKGIQVTLDSGGWLYLRSTASGLEIYAEDSDSGRARRLTRSGELYLRSLAKELGPSGSLRWSLLFATGLALFYITMVVLPLISPTLALQIPILGTIYLLVGRVVELGFGALEWLFPNMLRKVLPSWNHPWVMMMSVHMFLAFFWYWGMRALTFYSSVLRTRPQGALAPEIENLPDLPKQPPVEANDYFTVAPLKDGRLAVLKPAFARIWRWLQPLLFTYQAETLIQGKRYDDSNVLFRPTINARGWLFFKTFLLEPRIFLMTWWDLFSAAFPGFSRGLINVARPLGGLGSLWRKKSNWNPLPGLPGHISPAVGISLPAVLRGRYRTEFSLVKKISDGDTVQLFDGSFWGSRWVRYKGMDASDNKRGDLYRRAKERNIQMVRGKKVLLLIPQIKQGDHMADEYEAHGRLMAYVYVQDESGQWINMTLLLLREGLATTEKGAPDPEVPYSLDVFEPLQRHASILRDPSGPLNVQAVAADRLLSDKTADQKLAELGAQVGAQAQLRLEESFAGAQGEHLDSRMGRGAKIGERGQFFISGEDVRIGKALELGADAQLELKADGGKIRVGDGVVISGRLRVIAPPEAQLRILNGTRFDGEREITLRPGQSMSLRNLPDGSLSLQSEHQHPDTVWRKLWAFFKRQVELEKLLDWIEANRLAPATLTSFWKPLPQQVYDSVRLPSKLKALKMVGKERSFHLDGKHEDFLAEAVAEKKKRMLGSTKDVPRKFLMRGDPPQLKQLLLLGLERHHQILIDRQTLKIKEMIQRLEGKLEKAELNQAERRRFVQIVVWEEIEEDAEIQAQVMAQMRALPDHAQALVRRIKAEIESLYQLQAKKESEIQFYANRAQKQLAGLAGLILLGPRRFSQAVSVVLGGSYLFARAPGAPVELLVVQPGEEGPKRLPASLLKDIPLPEGSGLSLVSVGEGWLKRHTKEGMRNRLLSRFLATGTTLWGRDLAAARADQIGGRLPEANILSLADEFLSAAAADVDLAYLAHLIALSLAPGLLERIPEEEHPEPRKLVAEVRRQIATGKELVKKEELRRIIGRGISAAAAHSYADAGLGGVFVGDVERKPLYKMSSKEAWAWIRELTERSAPVEDAQVKLDELLERLKSRGLWWAWYPERLEQDHFVVIGRDSRGRLVEARVKVANATQAMGALAVIAESEEGRAISDVDRYEIFLNGAVFELDSAAQEVVLDAVVRQLEQALAGRSLREARDVSSRELILSDKKGGRSGVHSLLAAVEDHARGIRVRRLGNVLRLPWQSSTWTGVLGLEDAERLAKGLADYAAGREFQAPPRFLIGYAAAQERAAAEAMAQVLTAKGLSVSLVDGPVPQEALAPLLAGGRAEMGAWISAGKTAVVGKNGNTLPISHSNEIGWLALRSRFVRAMPLEVAKERGLLETVAPPPAAAPAQKPQAPSAPAAVRKSSLAPMTAFLFHSLLIGLLAAIIVGTIWQPAFVMSLPFVHTIFTMVRAMMMFKSFVAIDSAAAVGAVLGILITGIRYWRYGKIMYRMSQGGGKYRGLIPELENLPKIRTAARRSRSWLPVEALLDGRIAIREESFARLSPFFQMLIYTYATARLQFNQTPLARYMINLLNKVVIGRFKIARVTFFVVTEPLVMLMEWAMLLRICTDKIMGRPMRVLYRVTPESEQGVPALPPEVEKNFSMEWVTVTAILDDSTVQLEDNRQIRLIGAGKPGKAVSLATPEARELLLGPEVLLLVPNSQEEGTRRVSGHLYVVEQDKSKGAARILTRGIHALAAKQGSHGRRLPATAAVDADKLPLFFDFQETNPSAKDKHDEGRLPRRGDKIFAGAVFGIIGSIGAWAFHQLSRPELSPLSHGLAFGLFGLLVLPALHGLWRLWRAKPGGFVLKRKIVAAILTATLGLGATMPLQGQSWTSDAPAVRLANGTLIVLENARLMPRSQSLGYAEQSLKTQELLAFSLPADHALVRQAREIYDVAPADAWSVTLPPELAANYHAKWSYVDHVIDGDTAVLSNGTHVRYLAYNAPETFHAGFDAKEKGQPGGEEALRRNAELGGGKSVLLLIPKDRAKDSYRRLLAYVYTRDASGRLVNSNIVLLETTQGNHRYGLPDIAMDPLVGGAFKYLDPKTLRPVPLNVRELEPRLALNPIETRHNVQEQVRLARWVDAQTMELSDGRRVRLRELIIDPSRKDEALELVRGLVKPDQAVFVIHTDSYDPKHPLQVDRDGSLLDYVYFTENGATYRNLNKLLDDKGFNTGQRGRPDAVMPEVVGLQMEALDANRAAWEAAAAPLRAIHVSDPQVAVAYWEKVRSLDQDSANAFQAGVLLLSGYSRGMMLPQAQQQELLTALIRCQRPADYDAWVADRLIPALRKSLEDQRIPAPEGAASWGQAPAAEILLWAAAGKLGAVPDSFYFPSQEQVARMKEFLRQNGLSNASGWRYGEGVVFAKLALRFPPEMRALIPASLLADGGPGAFWAAARLAQLHRGILDNETRVSPLLMSMAYAYQDSPWLLLPDARDYVVLTHGLATEVMATSGLMDVWTGHLGSVISEARLAEVRGLVEQGQTNKAVKALSPSEIFMLGRKLADDPELNRYQLKNLRELRAKAGSVGIQGTSMADFQSELDALLGLPGDGSLARAPLAKYETLTDDQWAMQRHIFADILVQVLVGMDHEKIPARFLPEILPKAVEFIERSSGRMAGPNDWAALVKRVNKISHGQIRSWVFQQIPQGYSGGRKLELGLLNRSIPDLLDKDIGARGAAEIYEDKKVVGELGFPGDFEADLKTFKHGSFRVDKGEGFYKDWREGDLIKIMVGKKSSRRSLYNTRIASIERKRLADLSLDDLRSEFPPSRFWNPLQDEEELRRELIAELIAGLNRFYPGVDENAEGFMIRFDSYIEVKNKNP